jgi:hypothetical protein
MRKKKSEKKLEVVQEDAGLHPSHLNDMEIVSYALNAPGSTTILVPEASNMLDASVEGDIIKIWFLINKGYDCQPMTFSVLEAGEVPPWMARDPDGGGTPQVKLKVLFTRSLKVGIYRYFVFEHYGQN